MAAAASVWWAMQHSNSRTNKAAIVTIYLDESGTNSASPLAVVGGVLLNRSGFLCLDTEWREMLVEHKVDAVHVKEFQPHGKYASWSAEKRRALFNDVAILVKRYRLRTISAALKPELYHTYFDDLFVQKEMSYYGFCFVLAAILTTKLAEGERWSKRIPLLLDEGNPYADQVLYVHSQFKKHSMSILPNLGSLSFDDDMEIMALQAADATAWASRRKLVTGKFPKGFEPLAEIVDEEHVHKEYSGEMLAVLADGLRSHIIKA